MALQSVSANLSFLKRLNFAHLRALAPSAQAFTSESLAACSSFSLEISFNCSLEVSSFIIGIYGFKFIFDSSSNLTK